jgi:hypothetical protein
MLKQRTKIKIKGKLVVVIGNQFVPLRIHVVLDTNVVKFVRITAKVKIGYFDRSNRRRRLIVSLAFI